MTVIVEREHDRSCASNDFVTGNKAVDSRICAVVSIVPKHEVVIFRNLDRAEGAQAACSEGNELDALRYARIRFGNEYCIRSTLDIRVSGFDPVDDQSIVPHRHRVPGQADDALDQSSIGRTRIEDDDVAALGICEIVNGYVSKRDPEIVRELVHQDSVAFDNRRLHGAGRNDIPVGKRTAKDDHQDDEQGKASVLVPRSHELVWHASSPVDPKRFAESYPG